MRWIFQEYPHSYQFYYRNDRGETGLLLKQKVIEKRYFCFFAETFCVNISIQ